MYISVKYQYNVDNCNYPAASSYIDNYGKNLIIND